MYKFRFHILFATTLLIVISICSWSCGSERRKLPPEFDKMTTEERVEWLSSNLKPDSLAHFLCDIGSGKDTIINVEDYLELTKKVYNQYSDSLKLVFLEHFNEYAESLPSDLKMRLYYVSSKENARRLGYEYGVELKKENKDSAKMKEDLNALKEICGDDTMFYESFVRGMNNAMK